jgi:SAM-dependent methyltransferase
VIEAGGLRVVDVLQRGRNARTGAAESQVSVLLAERPPHESCPARTPSAILDERRLRQVVQRGYASVALFPGRVQRWPVGTGHAAGLGYPRDALAGLPRLAAESFCGCAYPYEAMRPRPGETVVDVGSGSGVDALLAAELVGPSGSVVGIELTEELARKATLAARRAKRANVRFEKGLAEEIPLPDGSADLVLANGVVNLLVADKEGALREMFRVLRPGGRLVLADFAVARAAPRGERSTLERWLDALAGPIPLEELAELIRRAGFSGPEWTTADARLDGTALADVARERGAGRFVLRARKDQA